MTTRNLAIRLSVKDGEIVKRALQGLGKDGQRALERIERAAQPASKSLMTLNNAAQGAERLKVGLGSVAAAATAAVGVMASIDAATAALQGLIQTNLEYERLSGSLEAVMGSASAANREFARLQEFAKTTPFQLNEVVESFTKLQVFGLDASERSMKSFGNIASTFGKELAQFIEAVADASVFEFMRLQEFGVNVTQQTDRLLVDFRGKRFELEKNAKAIIEFLTRIGETEFGTAMEKQMERLPGKISNLQDSFSQLQAEIGENGFTQAMGDATDMLSAFLGEIKDSDAPRLIGESLGGAIKDTTEAAIDFAEAWGDDIVSALTSSLSAISSVVGGLNDVRNAISGIAQAQSQAEVEARQNSTFWNRLKAAPGRMLNEGASLLFTPAVAGREFVNAVVQDFDSSKPLESLMGGVDRGSGIARDFLHQTMLDQFRFSSELFTGSRDLGSGGRQELVSKEEENRSREIIGARQLQGIVNDFMQLEQVPAAMVEAWEAFDPSDITQRPFDVTRTPSQNKKTEAIPGALDEWLKQAQADSKSQEAFTGDNLSVFKFQPKLDEKTATSLAEGLTPGSGFGGGLAGAKPKTAAAKTSTAGGGKSDAVRAAEEAARDAQRAIETTDRYLQDSFDKQISLQHELDTAHLEGTEKRIADIQFQTVQEIAEATRRAQSILETEGMTAEQQTAIRKAAADEISLLYEQQKNEVQQILEEEQAARQAVVNGIQHEVDQVSRLLTAKQSGEQAYQDVADAIERENMLRSINVDLTQEEISQIDSLIAKQQEEERQLERLSELRSMSEGLNQRFDPDFSHKKQQEDLEAARESGMLSDGVYERAIRENDLQHLERQKQLLMETREGWNGAQVAIMDYMDTASNAAQNTYEVWNNAISSTEDALVDFVMTGKLEFKSLVQSIMADIARMQIRDLFSGLFGKSDGGGLGGLFSGISGLFGVFGGGTPAPVEGNLLTPIPGRAVGGPVDFGKPYMVGERGPELFVPRASGEIVPNDIVQSIQKALKGEKQPNPVGAQFEGMGITAALFGGFRAGGGDVTSGRAYIVGEKGPELFMAHASGEIMPNHALMDVLKSSQRSESKTVKSLQFGDININIPGGSPDRARLAGHQAATEMLAHLQEGYRNL